MIYCSVEGCYCYNKDGSKQRFFRFPKALERAWLWHDFCQDFSKAPSIKRYVCDKHFVESDFNDPECIYLKSSAIPSANGPGSLRKICGENTEERKSVTALKGKTFDSTFSGSNTKCGMAEDSSLAPQLDHKHLNNARRTKKSNHIEHARTSADIPNVELEQQSDVHECSGTIIKSFQRINPELKLSLLKSIAPIFEVKQKASSPTISDQRPLKIYKSTQKDLIVELQPQIVFPGGTMEEVLAEPKKRNDIFKIERSAVVKDCALKNVDITINSTLVFESANNSFTPNLLNKPKTSKLLAPESTDNSQTERLLANESFSIRASHLRPIKNKSKQKSSTFTKKNSRSLQKQLEQIKILHRKKLQRYRRKLLNTNKTSPHLDVNDPKYSIAAVAESLGTFNSFVEKPAEKVNLQAGEWFKLYEPSEITFPILSETQIGAMVNRLRNKLSTLNDRDRLEVSFLLSMMSVYPDAPDHIKELLSQRLNLLYISTIFEWNTALALGLNVYNQTSTSNTLSSKRISTTNVFRNKTFQNKKILASSNSNHCDPVKSDCINDTNDLSVTSEDNLTKPAKRPKFAFEIIVQEKSSKTKKDESCKTTKML